MMDRIWSLHCLTFHLLVKQPAQAEPESLNVNPNTLAEEVEFTEPRDSERYSYSGHCEWSGHLEQRLPRKATCSAAHRPAYQGSSRHFACHPSELPPITPEVSSDLEEDICLAMLKLPEF